jgi:hypothetical protein
MPNFEAAGGVGIDLVDRFVTSCCRSAQQRIGNIFLFDQFQIELPPDWNAIILPGKVGIGPVGVRP